MGHAVAESSPFAGENLLVLEFVNLQSYPGLSYCFQMKEVSSRLGTFIFDFLNNVERQQDVLYELLLALDFAKARCLECYRASIVSYFWVS